MSIINEVKSKILTRADRPDKPEKLGNGITLQQLKYTQPLCTQLEDDLQSIAEAHGTGKIINDGSVDPSKTVGYCISLVQ